MGETKQNCLPPRNERWVRLSFSPLLEKRERESCILAFPIPSSPSSLDPIRSARSDALAGSNDPWEKTAAACNGYGGYSNLKWISARRGRFILTIFTTPLLPSPSPSSSLSPFIPVITTRCVTRIMRGRKHFRFRESSVIIYWRTSNIRCCTYVCIYNLVGNKIYIELKIVVQTIWIIQFAELSIWYVLLHNLWFCLKCKQR